MTTAVADRPTTDPSPHEIVKMALTARCYIGEALALFDKMAPSHERTRVGRKLLDAYHDLGAWVDAGGYLGEGP